MYIYICIDTHTHIISIFHNTNIVQLYIERTLYNIVQNERTSLSIFTRSNKIH